MQTPHRGVATTPHFLLGSILAFIIVTVVPFGASAHEVRPAVLQIEETATGRYNVTWRTPLLSGQPLPVVLRLPDEVRNLKEPVVRQFPDALLERRWIDTGANGLAGKRIQVTGLQLTITEVLVRVEMLDGRNWTTILHPSQPWFELSAAPSKLQVAAAYLRLGIEHIWSGIDHLL